MDIKLIEQIGDVLQYAISVLALVVVLLTNSSLLLPFGVSVVATLLITHALKRILNKTKLGERPNGSEHSFPSGHTAGAFAGAAFFHFGLMSAPWVVGIAYALAAFTGYSRVVSGNHWVRDVVAGGILAVVTVFATLSQFA